MKKVIFSFLFLILPGLTDSIAQGAVVQIDTASTIADASLPPFDQVKPGDTLLLEPGRRSFLIIRNFLGAPGIPIIIINGNGAVLIETDHYFGISIRNCRYFRLTGSGDTSVFYGIAVQHIPGGSAIGIGEMSSDFEVDHISIEHVSGGGIYAKTDPDCSFSSTREKFTQFNTIIHDNYIADVGMEGLYIGSTKYFGQTINCNGFDTLLLPCLLIGVHVFNNIIKYTGWDGMQISSASSGCQIYHNTVMYDSQKEFYNQMSGILIGGGSKCDCFNNNISNGNGNGIESHGLGGYKIYNNLIVDAGRGFLPNDTTQMIHGIFLNDVTGQSDSSYNIMFNDIINPKSDGIRFASLLSRNNLIASNAIINPGNFNFYQNGHTSFKGVDSYIMFPEPGFDGLVKNNFFSRVAGEAKFEENGLSLRPDSPLINAGYPDTENIMFDFNNHPRVFGTYADIGAYEYNPAYIGIPENQWPVKPDPGVFPDPVNQFLVIRFDAPVQSELVLDIIDFQGKIVLQKKYPEHPGGEMTCITDVGQMIPGIYFYSLHSDGKFSTGRFIKSN